jgi:thiol-disulfide isomerase/thioredoxin
MQFRLSAMAPLFAAGLALSLLSACGKARVPGEIPVLTLKTYAGDDYTFDPKDGNVTLVVFWATWCVPCIEEIPHLKDFHETFAEQGFRVVSINIDDPEGENAPTLMRQFEINYPVLIEKDGRAEKAFGGLRALPTSFLVGRDGQVKRRLEGLYPQATVERMIVAEL